MVGYSRELESGLNRAIELIQLYETEMLGENTLIVNRDFTSNILTPEQVNSYMALYTNGVISWDRFLSILERGEVLEILAEKDREAEKLKLQDESLGE